MIYEVNSEKETKDLGIEIGKNAKKKDIYCLVGDLGTGKTIMSKGIAYGLGVEGEVTSPTFTILNIYDGKFTVNHFDVYRITNNLDMFDIGFDDIIYGDGVSVIEWADIIKDIIPTNATWIYIEKDLDKGNDYRKITLEEGK